VPKSTLPAARIEGIVDAVAPPEIENRTAPLEVLSAPP
jgi:hypothetical protein